MRKKSNEVKTGIKPLNDVQFGGGGVTSKALLAALLLGVTPAVASDLGTPTLGDDSAYTLTKVDTAGKNTITKFEYNSSTGEFTPVYYQMNLKQTSYGHPDVADEVRYYKFAENGGLTTGTADDYDIIYSVDSSRAADEVTVDASGLVNNDFIDLPSSGSNYLNSFINTSRHDIDIRNITGDFVEIEVKAHRFTSSYDLLGGIISNSGNISNITGNFIGNSPTASEADALGGGIYNSTEGLINNISGNFIGNSVKGEQNGFLADTGLVNYSEGGAIYNLGKIDSINAHFINNYATHSTENSPNYNTEIRGGAISNYGDIAEINGDFINNSIQYDSKESDGSPSRTLYAAGGAIYNCAATIGSIKGDFIGNNILSDRLNAAGGAIYNDSGWNTPLQEHKNGTIHSITGNFINNSVTEKGGAIYNSGSQNYYGIINSITGNFTNNTSAEGGAIYNSGIIAALSGDFINNHTVVESYGSAGGAIYNTGTIKNISGNFINNYAVAADTEENTYGANGGAIYNEGIINNITGDFIGNTAKEGGAIDNEGYITITDSTFENNYSSEYSGGAINNHFSAYDRVGENPNQPSSLALYSDGEDTQTFQPYLTIKNTTFNNNTSASSGGAIFSQYNYNLEKYTGGTKPPIEASLSLMSNIETASTPATYAETPVISIENSSFQNNIAKSGDGGAISFYYNENIQTYLGQSSPGQPGSLVLADSGISLLDVGGYPGGYPEETTPEYQKTSNFLNIKNSEFVGNKSALGGAISFRYDKIETNIAEEPPAEPVSLLTEETEPEYKLVLENTSFANNSVALPEDYTPSEYGDDPIPQGGAIFTNADTKIVADNGNSIFSNNTVTANGVTQKNDIYIVSNTNSTINVTPDENNWDMVPSIDATQEKFNPVTLSLEAKNNGTISFDGTIDGEATYSKAVLDENGHNGNWYDYFETEKLDTPYAYNLDIKGDETGRVVFNNDVKNANVTVADTNVYFGTRDNIFDGNNLELKSGMLSMVNGGVGVSALNTFTISGDTNFVADVNLQDQTMDRITADTYGAHTGNLNVVGMNILNDAPVGRDTTEIFFAETGLMDNVVNGTGELPDSNYQVALTPIYKYNVGYETREDDGGYFVFTRGDKIPTTPGGSTGGGSTGNPSDAFNPSVLATPVGNLAAGQAAMNEAFKYVFEHADAFTQLPAMERYAKINANKYALSTDFNDNLPSYADNLHNKGVWFRPYTTFETMNIKNGPKVDAITYGSLVGFDGDFKEMKNGWSRVFTGYAGYMGSSLNYSGVDTTMNGGLLGFTETFYKGNFWTAITASAGASVGESHTMYGKEDYTSLLAGVGSKTGYNFEFKDGKFIIQPIMFLSYTFVNTFDYKNAAGVSIESDPLHTIQLNPSVRFIANLKGGWQPYASVGMVWNLMNESKVTANNVKLPEMSVKPYVEYGVGVQRNWADKFTAFLQAMIRNGGRNGVALTGGFRFMLGSEPKNSDKPKVKKEIKSL